MYNWEELRELKALRLISIREHPYLPYSIINYTESTQHGRMWDHYPILKECRGLILDTEGNVVARGFNKFFNVGEVTETKPEYLATLGAPEIVEKVDGSLAILYPEGDHYAIATRGTFSSREAALATLYWANEYSHLEPKLGPYTYLFEYIGPFNRIVVRYPQEELILIGLIDQQGTELPYSEVCKEGERLGFPLPQVYTGNWLALKDVPVKNFEGYVLFWPEHQLRAKVKLQEYLDIHRIVVGLSEKSIWKKLLTNEDLSLTRIHVHEEDLDWFDGIVTGFLNKYQEMEKAVLRVQRQFQYLNPKNKDDRKQIAMLINRGQPELRAASFRAIDGQDYRETIFKALEPKD